MKYVPLEIAFARTLHKVQGQSIGPTHAVPIMVFNPGKTSFEGRNPGLLYTGISRATSLGANDVNRSAIYFNCSNKGELYTRVRDIHYKRKRNNTNKQKSNEAQMLDQQYPEPMLTNEKYTKVKKRKYWTDYLDEQEKLTNISSTVTARKDINNWLQRQQEHVTSENDLYRIVQFHSKRYKRA
ncbi:ATP-dependent DNA helicase PIF1-like [Chaetoceros tenuissimus]|nr:ATP-dependent DNA helicase PIF1-like [Chaetoceros tenuissimus]